LASPSSSKVEYLSRCACRPTRSQALLGAFFALTGALITTSLVNIGSSGVPLYVLAFGAPALVLSYNNFRPDCFALSRTEYKAFAWLAFLFVLLFGVTFLHLTYNLQPVSEEIPHGAIRITFIAYCTACIYCLQGATLKACLTWLRRIITVCALYGVYQLPAKALGLPLFLEWLRNNRSFDIYDFNTAGWINLIRATSIYAEPSQAAVPVVVVILINRHISAPRYSKVLVLTIALLFAALTFSRSVWIAILCAVLGIYLSKKKKVRDLISFRPALVASTLLFAILAFPLWAFVSGNYTSDLSRQERAGSIVIGLQLLRQHPLMGSGWNSYEVLMPQYQITVDEVAPTVEFRTIHNMFISYTQQAGVAGFCFALCPFLVILFVSKAPLDMRMGTLLAFLSTAELGGDIGYSSIFWLWIAILVNMKSCDDCISIHGSQYVGTHLLSDTPGMLEAPSSPS
jgi:O-antigen ligase